MDAPRPPRALVCADEPALVHAVRVMLEGSGVEVVATAATPTEAILAARATEPAFIVLDLTLSGALGLRIVGALQAAAPDAAVVVLSPFESLRGAAVDAGALELVTLRDLRRLGICVNHVLGVHCEGCEDLP